ncbi:MAG: D-alanine--D-alanine ligase [Candidatus Sumerlaeia bacterium]|nr:D-alanine--D-alanine ligase [Candidatus Sumerlaeia bacterium]
MTQSRKKTKLKLWVLCGGQSPEHTVSLSSARTCTAALDLTTYKVKPVCITRISGLWLIPDKYLSSTTTAGTQLDKWFSLFSPETQERISCLAQQGIQALPVHSAIERLKCEPPDLIFLLLHGPAGEDGKLQGLLDFVNVPYTGSGVLASALAMDKVRCQEFLRSREIPVPPSIALKLCGQKSPALYLLPEISPIKVQELWQRIITELGIPVIIKPSRCGSSVGMSIVKEKSELLPALRLASSYDDELLIEKFISGTEVTCGILEIRRHKKSQLVALPLTEIVPRESAFFDYESKYIPGKTEEITPARISKTLTRQTQQLALRAFKAVGCRGMARMDFIIDIQHRPFLLEINTIPGMTPTSLLPQGAKALGIDFPRLLDLIIQSSLS